MFTYNIVVYKHYLVYLDSFRCDVKAHGAPHLQYPWKCGVYATRNVAMCQQKQRTQANTSLLTRDFLLDT